MSSYKNLIIGIILIAIICGIYFTGKSAGYDSGYNDAKSEVTASFELKMKNTSEQLSNCQEIYTEYVRRSNARVSELEKESIELRAKYKDATMQYKHQINQLTMSQKNAKERAWTEETVQFINKIIEAQK